VCTLDGTAAQFRTPFALLANAVRFAHEPTSAAELAVPTLDGQWGTGLNVVRYWPPAMTTFWPVTHEPAGDASHNTAAAMSIGRPSRPKGMRLAI
jgi:hypothetical protein